MPLNANRKPHGSSGEDLIEAALVWAARWTPDETIRSGMLFETITRHAAGRSQGMGSGRRVLRIAAVLAVPAAIACVMGVLTWKSVLERPYGTETHVVVDAGARPDAAMPPLVAAETAGPDIKAPDARLAAGTNEVPTSPTKQATRPLPKKTAARRQGDRPTKAPSAGPAPRWRTYSVRRYVAGISAAGWLSDPSEHEEARAVPIMVSIPLAEGYGDPSDRDGSELDVIPVKHLMEVDNE